MRRLPNKRSLAVWLGFKRSEGVDVVVVVTSCNNLVDVLVRFPEDPDSSIVMELIGFCNCPVLPGLNTLIVRLEDVDRSTSLSDVSKTENYDNNMGI